MNKEEIIATLSRISTPTGLTSYGDETLDDHTCDEILDFIAELEDKNTNLKQALNEIKDYVKDNLNINQLVEHDILQIIDKVGGNEK